MERTRFIVHEEFTGKRKPEDVFAAVFLSNAAALTEHAKSSIIKDTETGWYYLQSRYYDPDVGRFLNADVFVSTGQGLRGTNMFIYCGNDPVNFNDNNGCAPGDLFGSLDEAIQDFTNIYGDFPYEVAVSISVTYKMITHTVTVPSLDHNILATTWTVTGIPTKKISYIIPDRSKKYYMYSTPNSTFRQSNFVLPKLNLFAEAYIHVHPNGNSSHSGADKLWAELTGKPYYVVYGHRNGMYKPYKPRYGRRIPDIIENIIPEIINDAKEWIKYYFG